MRKFTKLFLTFALLCIAGVANAATEYEIDQKFTSIAELDGQSFAIVNEAEGKAVFNPQNQDLAFGTYSEAVAATSYLYVLESLADNADENVKDCYQLRAVKADGTNVSFWGNAAVYLNSGAPTSGGFNGCFILGNGDKFGTDFQYGGIWKIEYVEGQGFALKNKGTDGYFVGVTSRPEAAEPTYWTFCTIKEKPNTDPLAEQKEALEAAIAQGKMFNALAYSEASFTALGTAITAGEAALVAADATAESLTDAKTAIEAAQAALALKDGYIELTQAQFFEWDSATEPTTSKATGCAYELFKPSNMVYGNSSVGLLTFADLSAYDKFIVTVAEGTPRILLNRDINEGQWNANEEESHLIDNTLDGWHNKYFTSEDNVFTVDVKQLAADKGFAHLHSIKSRGMVTVTGLYLYKEGEAPAEATTVDWVAGEQGYENTQDLDGVAISIDGKTTMTCTIGTGSNGPKFYTSGSAIRTYGGNVITFKGEGITKIIITGVSGKVAELTANTGELTTEGIVTTWKGEADEIVLTNSTTNQQHIAKLHVVYGGVEPDAEPVHIANTAETAYTVAKAIELIDAGDALDETVFVKGTVSKVDDLNNGAITYWISADGTTEGAQFECYKGKGIEGADFAALEDIEVGAEVIVTGKLAKYQTTYELSAGNALVSYKAPVKPVIAEGNYYLYNVAADGFVVGANNWGTRASISKIGGIEVEAVMTPEGKYELKTASLYAGKHLGFNGYVDNGDESNWTITPVEGQEGVYTLTSTGTNVLFWDGGEATTTSVGAMPETAENAYWKFIPVADRLANLANATAENPIDATFLINNPEFGRATSKAAWQGDDFGIGGGDHVNNNAEKWGGNSQTFDVKQTVEVPNGIYKITWNGFYRYNNTTDNTNDIAAAAHADGSEVINSFVYLNDQDYPLTSIADEAAVAAFEKMPFSQGDAAAAFGMGLYEQSAEITVEDGQLTIGVKKTEHPGCDWTVWDNFRVTYFGVPVPVVHTWDFTKWGEETVANLKAEAAKVTVEDDPDNAGKTLCTDNDAQWSDHEKKPGTACDTYAASKDNCFWSITTPDENGELAANGVTIAELKGLSFNSTYSVDRALAIAVNYPSTSLGTYNGPAYLWFGGKNKEILTIKNVKAGTTITMGIESHKPAEARGVKLLVGETELTDPEGNAVAAPTTYVEQTWAVPAGEGVVDVVVKNTNGCHIYFIDAEIGEAGPEVTPDEPELVAPEGWTMAIANGNLAGDDVSSYVSKEQSTGETVPSTIVAGAGKNGSRGIVVNSSDDPSQAWDTQFWIVLNEKLQAGAKLHVQFDYKANKAAKATTQAHGAPGAYQHWAAIGDVNFTEDWQTFSTEIEVSADMANGNGGDGLLSIAFNLAEEKTATEYCFDNFGVWYQLPKPVEKWADLIVNGDMEGESMECFYVTEQGVGGPFVAVATEGIGVDGSKAVKVQSADDPTQDWDTQFFVRLPYELPAGTKFKFSFDYKASNAAGSETQSHNEPGQYIHWACAGSPSFTTEWQSYKYEGNVPSECDGSDNNGGYKNAFQTIAFNLAVLREATEFIFDNVKFEVEESIVSSLTKDPAVDPKPYPVGIKTVNASKEDGLYYDLQGRRVAKPAKGLYIVNGTKVMVK